MATNQIGLLLPASELFPGIDCSAGTLKTVLNGLSLTDTLFWCARLNLVVCDPHVDHLTKQQFGLNQFLTTEDISRVNEFARRHGGAEQVTVFFRGQLLELIRWVALYCTDHPNDGTTFEDPSVRRKFAQAALMAGELWSTRIFGDRFSAEAELGVARQRSLGAIRKGVEGTLQAPDLAKSLGRGWTFFSDYVPRYNRSFNSDFHTTTGFSVEDYFICLGAMITSYIDPKLGTGLFDANTFARSTAYAETLNRFIERESQTAYEVKMALWGSGVGSNTTLAIPDYDYRALREKPILRSADGRAIILDPVFFSEKASIGPVFLLPREQRQQALSDLGKAFEAYSGDMLGRMFPDIVESPDKRFRCNILGTDIEGTDFEIDACLNDRLELVLFEIKTGLIREDSILGENHESLLTQLRLKYVWNEDEKAVGVGQLARVISILAARKWVGSSHEFSNVQLVYPVLLVHDPLLAAPVYGHFLAEEFKEVLAPEKELPSGELRKAHLRVAPLIIMTVDDLENLETSIEHFGFRDLLSAYSEGCPDRLMSLQHFMITSTFKDHIFQNRSIAAAGLNILEKVKEKVFAKVMSN